MAEQLYTIPVNDAFTTDCECPICEMNRQLERNAIDYTMGPSYMEDDNRLGLALMLKTHTDKTIRDLKALSTGKPVVSGGLFKKQASSSVSDYIKRLENSCFICNRMKETSMRYIDTICGRRSRSSVRSLQTARAFVPIIMESCMMRAV